MFTSTVYWKGGRAFYPPWSVEWVEEDNKTLNPPWPTLTSDMLIATWVPGDAVASGTYDNKGSGVPTVSPLPESKLGKVGLPLVVTFAALLGLVLLAGVVFWCLWRRRAKKKVAKEEHAMEDTELSVSRS